MARKWSNLNLPGALHFVTGNCINRLPVFTEPECLDHDWWWPDDAEKLSKAMKEMGWHSYWKRDEDE